MGSTRAVLIPGATEAAPSRGGTLVAHVTETGITCDGTVRPVDGEASRPPRSADLERRAAKPLRTSSIGRTTPGADCANLRLQPRHRRRAALSDAVASPWRREQCCPGRPHEVSEKPLSATARRALADELRQRVPHDNPW